MKFNDRRGAAMPSQPAELDFLDIAPILVRRSMVIRCTPADVFALVACDPSSWGRWCPGFTTASQWSSQPPHGVGSRRTMRAYGRNFEETILAWEPDIRFAFRVDRGAGSSIRAFVEDWRLEGVEGGAKMTRATWTMGIDATLPSAPLRLMVSVHQAVLMLLAKGRIERIAGAMHSGPA